MIYSSSEEMATMISLVLLLPHAASVVQPTDIQICASDIPPAKKEDGLSCSLARWEVIMRQSRAEQSRVEEPSHGSPERRES